MRRAPGLRPALRPVERLAPLTLALALAAPLPGCAQTDAPDLDRAREATRAGRYEEAIASYRALVQADLAFPAAPRELAAALAAVGRYEGAIEALRETAARRDGTAELDRILGVMLGKTGDLEGAESSFHRSVDANATDALLARLELGRLLYHRGDLDRAIAIFDGFIDVYNEGGRLSARELASVGTALTYLGIRDPALFHDAVRAYEEAIGADPDDAEIKVQFGELFLSKYDSREAGGLFAEVLEANPRHAGALLGMARRAKFDGSSESLDLARRSLESNPFDATAIAFLAHLYLDLEDVENAGAEARRAIDANPSSVEGWIATAAVAHLLGEQDAFSDANDRIFSLNPRNAGLSC